MFGLLPGDIISGHIAFTGFYELALSRLIVKLAAQGGLLVDVGANMGYFSLLWAGRNPAARAVAFEASPRNLALLQNNLDKNGLTARITLIPKAAGQHPGNVTFHAGPAGQTGWGGISKTASAGSIDVPLVRIDQELPAADIAVLKIDVEGADTWVLQGCAELLRQKRIQVIFFEQNQPRMQALGIAPGEAQRFLRSHDYTCVPLGTGTDEWTAYPNSHPA